MATSQYVVHTVGAGDTIQAIGDLYGVGMTSLLPILATLSKSSCSFRNKSSSI